MHTNQKQDFFANPQSQMVGREVLCPPYDGSAILTTIQVGTLRRGVQDGNVPTPRRRLGETPLPEALPILIPLQTPGGGQGTARPTESQPTPDRI